MPVPSPNSLTPAGLAAAKAELDELVRTNGDADRARELSEHLATAHETPPPDDRGSVGLGARVTVEDDDGRAHVYEIVGAIEADAKAGKVSWQSPIAQALWGAKVGDAVVLPRGDATIVGITYPENGE